MFDKKPFIFIPISAVLLLLALRCLSPFVADDLFEKLLFFAKRKNNKCASRPRSTLYFWIGSVAQLVTCVFRLQTILFPNALAANACKHVTHKTTICCRLIQIRPYVMPKFVYRDTKQSAFAHNGENDNTPNSTLMFQRFEIIDFLA